MDSLRAALHVTRPALLDRLAVPAALRVAVLGPHPDDFDVVAVTLRHLANLGAAIELAVLSTGISGVEDAYCPAERKAEKRRQEQRSSCRLFGLPESAIHFLPLGEDADGEPADTDGNAAQLASWLCPRRPHLVFLPHGHDQKGGHRNVYALFARVAHMQGLTPLALLNRDPKTISFRADACMPYDEEAAHWKALLLRCHDSQQQRNLRSRGSGFDERILGMDRTSARELNLAAAFAEVFEVEDLA